MKKLIYTIVILGIISITSLQAQDYGSNNNDDNGKGGFGIKGGLTFSTIGFDNETALTQKNRFRIGGTGGIGYEFATAGSFAFELDLMYDLRGTKEVTELIGGNEIVQKNYLHYIALPANFKFYLGDNFNFYAGGFASVLVGGKTRYQLKDDSGEVLETKNYKITGDEAQDLAGNDYLKMWDAGLQAGLEFVSNGGFGIGTNFSKGLVDVSNDKHLLGKGYASTTEISLYMIIRM